MAIVDIEAGSKASSQLVNDNFHYLQDLVGELSLKIDGSENTVDSKIATLKNTLLNEIMNESLPVGSIMAWSTATPPAKWLPMVGQDISLYEKLVSVIGTDKLPDTRNRVLWGGTTPLNTVEAGLPNITGQSPALRGCDYVAGGTGALYSTAVGNGAQAGVNTNVPVLNFDASRSSSIYGNSDTVQPPAVTVVWIIKYE